MNEEQRKTAIAFLDNELEELRYRLNLYVEMLHYLLTEEEKQIRTDLLIAKWQSNVE